MWDIWPFYSITKIYYYYYYYYYYWWYNVFLKIIFSSYFVLGKCDESFKPYLLSDWNWDHQVCNHLFCYGVFKSEFRLWSRSMYFVWQKKNLERRKFVRGWLLETQAPTFFWDLVATQCQLNALRSTQH